MKIVSLGEVMMRLSCSVDEKMLNKFDVYFGGGEYNTLQNLANFGHDTIFVSTLPNNDFSKEILKKMQANNINVENININGEKLGVYYTFLGDEVTSTNVIYDRKYSAFYNSKYTDYEFDKVFKGADLFHVSGITAALSSETKDMAYKAICLAYEMGIKVSYDSNYRSKLWSQKEAGEFLEKILPYVDYVFLGILDMKYLLNMNIKDLEQGYKILQKNYPNLKLIASTNREVINPVVHSLSANVFKDSLYKTDKVHINVVDRIGGGDAFVAGVLDQVLQGETIENIAYFSLANAVIKHHRKGDNYFASLEEVKSYMTGESSKINR